MALRTDKELKIYYSISEVAQMFGVNESLLRYWEKEFPFIAPKKAGGNIRQYRKEDIDNVRLVYHLVKEKGMTLAGAKQRLKQEKELEVRNVDIIERLKDIKEELLDKDGFYNKIHQLRNANEHKIEYELGIGHGQESFINEVSTKYGKIKTNSHWLLQVEDELFVGDVNFVEILNHMAVYRDKIIPVLERICWEYYGEVPQS